jgi:hypothetical protein
MQFVGTEPLTLANLGLPQFQVKDTGRVESFVRSQWLHSSTFASESRAFAAKPQQCKGHSEKHHEESILPSARYQGVGFSSPVLKARADKIQDTAPAASVLANESSKASDRYYENGRNKFNRGRKRDTSTRYSDTVLNKGPVSQSRPSRKAAPRLNIEHTARKES